NIAAIAVVHDIAVHDPVRPGGSANGDLVGWAAADSRHHDVAVREVDALAQPDGHHGGGGGVGEDAGDDQAVLEAGIAIERRKAAGDRDHLIQVVALHPDARL